MAVALDAAGARLPVPAAAAPCQRPLLGVAAVLMGAFISTLNTRVTTFGLADIRGGLSLGFDEGSWLTTAFSASQMIVAPGAAWLEHGVRRPAFRALGQRRLHLGLPAATFRNRLRHDDRLADRPRALRRHLHSRRPRLHPAQPAAALVDLGHRRLCLPLHLLPERRRLARGLVFRDRPLGMDLLAERRADAAHGR